jgi:hypothetical protein
MDQLRRRRWRRRVAWAASLLLLLPDTAEPFLVPLDALSHDGLVADLRVVRVHDCRNGPQYHHSHNNHRAAVAGQDRWPFVVVDDRPHGAGKTSPSHSCFDVLVARWQLPQTCLNVSVPQVSHFLICLAKTHGTTMVPQNQRKSCLPSTVINLEQKLSNEQFWRRNGHAQLTLVSPPQCCPSSPT